MKGLNENSIVEPFSTVVHIINTSEDGLPGTMVPLMSGVRAKTRRQPSIYLSRDSHNYGA